MHPLFAASLEAAAAAGDLALDGADSSANRFWFGHHIAAMMAFVLLPGRASIAYQGHSDGTGRGGQPLHPARHRHDRCRDHGRSLAGRATSPIEFPPPLMCGAPMDGDQMTDMQAEALNAETDAARAR